MNAPGIFAIRSLPATTKGIEGKLGAHLLERIVEPPLLQKRTVILDPT